MIYSSELYTGTTTEIKSLENRQLSTIQQPYKKGLFKSMSLTLLFAAELCFSKFAITMDSPKPNHSCPILVPPAANLANGF